MTAEQLAAKIRALLNDAPDGLVGSAIADACSGLEVRVAVHQAGCRNLREFILKNLPDVDGEGRSGADYRYKLPNLQAPVKQTQLSLPGLKRKLRVTFWSAWSNPNSSKALEVDETGAVQLAQPGASGQVLRPLTTQQHKEIAERFLSTRRGDIAAHTAQRLDYAVQASDNIWWTLWYTSVVRDASANALWVSYRYGEMESALDKALRDLKLSEEARKSARDDILATSRKPAPAGKVDKPTPSLRDIVTQAVAVMSEEQLRQLNIPVGIIHDILSGRSR